MEERNESGGEAGRQQRKYWSAGTTRHGHMQCGRQAVGGGLSTSEAVLWPHPLPHKVTSHREWVSYCGQRERAAGGITAPWPPLHQGDAQMPAALRWAAQQPAPARQPQQLAHLPAPPPRHRPGQGRGRQQQQGQQQAWHRQQGQQERPGAAAANYFAWPRLPGPRAWSRRRPLSPRPRRCRSLRVVGRESGEAEG